MLYRLKHDPTPLHDPYGRNQHSPDKYIATTPAPRARIPKPPQQRARNGRPKQQAHSHNQEGETNPRAHHAPVLSQPHKDGRLQAEKASGPKPIDGRHGQQGSERVAGGGEGEGGGGQTDGGGEDGVDGADAVGGDVWEDAAEGAGQVEQGEYVRGRVGRGEGAGD